MYESGGRGVVRAVGCRGPGVGDFLPRALDGNAIGNQYTQRAELSFFYHSFFRFPKHIRNKNGNHFALFLNICDDEIDCMTHLNPGTNIKRPNSEQLRVIQRQENTKHNIRKD